MTTRDFRIYLFLVSCLAVYAIARAARVPWVHDECASLLWYAEPGSFLPSSAHADANNHILSSALGAIFIRLFGLSLIASRLGSLLAFGLYAFAAWRLGAQVRSEPLRWCLWSVLLCCPFLFEFFSLFRGYGLELAFFAMAVDGGLRWARTRSLASFTQLLGGFVLADLSVLALVPLWVLLIGFLVGSLVVRRRMFERRSFFLHAFVLLVLGVVPAIRGCALAFDLRAKGLLYHGSTDGFLPVTVGSLSRLVLGVDGTWIRLAIALLCLCPIGVTILLKAWRRPLGIVTVALLCDVFMRIAMALLLDVNYPEDRAGIHLLWLALFALVLALDELSSVRPGLRWAGLLLMLLPLRSLLSANVDRTSLWPEQSVPERFVMRLDEMQRKSGRTLVLGAYHQLDLTVPYMARQLGIRPMRVHSQGFPQGRHDVRIVDSRYLAAASIGFVEVDRARANDLHLLVREPPWRSTLINADSTLVMDPDNEFFPLWEGEVGHDVLLAEVRCSIQAGGPLPDVLLVAATKDAEGNDLVYDAVRPSALGAVNAVGPTTLSARFEPVPNAARYVLYFWNATKRPVWIDDVRLHVSVLK